MQSGIDADTVHEYGKREPSFGGAYFDGDVLVALFTTDIDEHASRLLPTLEAPDQFRVTVASRAYSQVTASNARVQMKLMHSGRYPEVVGVGIGMSAGQFVVKVRVEGLTDAVAAALRDAVAPDDIQIGPGYRAVRS
ncbi:MAG: hypothetical protein M3N95_16640 [Actinomycetota bacterium]|nr:hypothetical protein [Actinomycetota bacterium]